MANTANAQFTQASDESINTTREVLKTSLASIEKLTKINLDVSKKFLEETTITLKQISGVTDPKKLFEKVNQLATNAIEHNLNSCRDVCAIVTETQNKISKTFESHMQNAQKNIVNVTEKFSKLNPNSGSAFGSNVMQKWVESTNQAMDTLNKMAASLSQFAHNSTPKSTSNTTSGNTRKTARK